MNSKFLILISDRKLKLLLFLLMLSPLALNYAQTTPVEKMKHWSTEFSIGPYYDSNILKYSDKYITRFLNGEDEGRFHINRYDDLVVQYAAGVAYTNEFINKLLTTLSFDFSYNKYSFNNIKDWSRFSFGLRQNILPQTSFMFSYSYIPHFYVRHFRDEDWIAVYGYIPLTFQPYEFSKDDFSFWVQQYIFKNTRARLYFSYYRYFLDKNNTEYDSNDYMFGIRVYQILSKDLSVNAGYKYIKSNAKGYDEPGETIQTSDDVNATNYSHSYFAGISYSLPSILNMRNSISIDAQYERAIYTTDQFYELDPIHAGRHDDNYDMTIAYDIAPSGNIRVTAFYSLLKRITGTPVEQNAEYISDEKSYDQYQTGVKINYNLEF